jgi:hypothetical protein
MPRNSSTTQEFIAIKDIYEDIVILKDGGLRQIIMTSGINLDLKSEEEQRIILLTYQNFLNALDFPIQFLVHSRKFNIGAYLSELDKLKEGEENELLRNQIFEYREFIKAFVEQNNIMTKSFLVIVPFYPVGITLPTKWEIWKLFGKKEAPSNQVLEGEEYKSQQIYFSQLRQRTEHVIEGLRSIGLRAVILNNEELMELFYNFYNPEVIEKTQLKIAEEK